MKKVITVIDNSIQRVERAYSVIEYDQVNQALAEGWEIYEIKTTYDDTRTTFHTIFILKKIEDEPDSGGSLVMTTGSR